MKLIGLPSTKYLLLLALLTVMCLAICGCGPSITVNMVEPVENTPDTQIKHLSNCNQETELISVMEIQQQYQIDDYAISGLQGKQVLIPPETMAELEVQLETSYIPVYEAALASYGQIKLTAPADLIRAYTIEWTELVYSSTITYRAGLKKYSTTYTYTFRIPQEKGYSDFVCYP